MKVFLIFFVIFMTENFLIINSEYVTLFTPKFVQEDAIYRLFVYPTDLKEVTDVAIQFRKTSATYRLDNGKIGAIEYNSKQRNFGDIKSYDMTMTLMRNVTLSSGLHHYCTSRNISVQTKTGNFYNFIQTDKPIYKPGDTVQFRVLTVDKDLLPFHRDSINVTITDPQGHPIYNFQNQAGKYIGVFDDNFTLSTDTTLGDWMITVVVDRRSTMAVSKIFAVQKYKLPLFDITIDLTDTHVLSSDDLYFSFYAKYSFGEYVKGYAEIMIREPVNKHVYFKESFFDIQSPKSITKNLESIGAYTYDVLQLEVIVVFTEPQSGIRFNKSAPFFVHAGDQHKIVAVHSDKFLPGFPFLLKVNIYDWKNELVMDSVDDIEITWSYTQQMGITGSKTNIEHLTNGVFKTEFDVPMNYVELSVDINFLDSEPYHQDIEMGSTNVGMNTLVVSHAPNSPNLNDTVKIFVSSDQQLNNLIYAVVTRYGNTDARLVECNGKQPCEFNIKIEEQMMPHSTVMVYYVKSQQVVFQGKTKIETRNLGENYLTIDLPSTKAKTKEAINMKISTKQKSKVYMLAFDKRLTYLRDGNDITKDDIVTSVADYDGENNILVDDLSLWKECTIEEIERVNSGRTYVTNQGGTDTVIPHEPDDSMEFFLTSFPNPDLPKTKNGLLRQYFPETWIFETIEVGPLSEFEKTYTVPDSMTTWLLSAFSIHNDYGLAVSSRQDLVVKDEFFIQLNLPYSIRYTEVLKLEVLVFNYIDSKENITVDLKLNNLNTDMVFQFVDYSVDCEPSYHDGTSASSKVSVEANGMSTIHFYVRSNPLDNNFSKNEQKMMILDVEASAKSISGKTYQDHVQQKIVVDPVGIKLYIVASNFYKLDGGSKSYVEKANYSQYLTHIDVILTGDYLSGLINLDKEFELYPSDYIKDDVAKFKRNVATFQYLCIKGKSPSKSILYQQYQTVLAKLIQGYSNANSSSFRANFGDIIATAMTVGAIPKDNQTVYMNFDIVQKLQDSSGTFSPQDFDFSFRQPDRNLDSLTVLNLKYYAAAYCLIPFIKHRQIMDNRYNDFIKKGFQYLDKVENRLGVFNIGLSIAAYVYALDNQKDKAKFLLEQGEKDFVELEDNKKCYKVTSDDKNCDIEHTVYVALTYLALNDLLNAQPIVYYLLSKKQPYDLTQNVKYLSIITEPIAKMGIMLNIENTNLKVTIKNEKDFQTILSISNKNSNVSQTIQMPPGSTEVNSVISGNGYCTISAVFERIITVPVVNDPFDLSYYIDDNISTDDEKYVAVVLRYSPGSEDKPVIRSVVFEVEMPSGYIYSKYKANDYPQKVQEVRTRRQGTVVDLFFENLEADEYITMEFGARKKYKVRDATNAGIKVYDYDHKDRVAVQFYKFKDYDDNEC